MSCIELSSKRERSRGLVKESSHVRRVLVCLGVSETLKLCRVPSMFFHSNCEGGMKGGKAEGEDGREQGSTPQCDIYMYIYVYMAIYHLLIIKYLNNVIHTVGLFCTYLESLVCL